MKIPKKILVIQTAFLGDVILATAILEKIKFHHPNSSVDFLIRKGNEGIFENNPILNTLYIWDKSNKIKDFFRIIKLLRIEKYDAVVNCQRFFTSGLFTIFSASNYTVGFSKNPLSWFFTKRFPHRFDGTHEVERNQQLIADFTDFNFIKPKVYPKEQLKVSEKYITISPGSVWATKQFPKEKWVAFIASLPKEIAIYLLGSKADIEISDWIKAQSNRENISIKAGQLSLIESAAWMKSAEMNYVNDSAPLHLASAVNAPTCAIFCSTSPSFGYGPLASNAKIVETSKKLSCKPCGIHGKKKCPQNHFDCGHTIEIEKLLIDF